MASKAIEKEFEKWMDSDVETALIEKKKVTDSQIQFVIGENEDRFTVNFPKEYPNSKEKLVVATTSESLAEWQVKLNKTAHTKLADLLTEAAESYLDVVGEDGDGDEEDDDMGDEDDMLGLDSVEKQSKPKKSKEDQEIDAKEFLEIGSATATMRLIKDLKNIQKGKPNELGFSATPVKDQKSGLENLYHWDVKLFNFDKDCDISKDMIAYKKKSGQDFILLELRFSKDYPFAPPFVRVVRPRFAFRTGHVTIGGSICMELLTNTGWNSTNDIESILIQIRAELLSGGARLDAGLSDTYEYSVSEAWDAFFRAARTHGWDTKGFGPEMFPKIP